MIWFMTTGYTSPRIKPVDVESSTEKSVTIKGSTRRSMKISSYECFFPTREEAHSHLLQDATRSVENARRELERKNGYLGNVKGMKPPTQ